MTDREIESRLKSAVESCTPDVLAGVMSGCEKSKGQVIKMTKTNKFRRFASIAAVLVLVLGISAVGLLQTTAGAVASIVSLDVNPSIELKLNKDAEVIEAKALNDDAEEILEGMKLKGTDVNTAANAIVGSLLKHGYIDELANSILVSVEDKDAQRGAKLQSELAGEIDAILSAASVNASVLAQYVDEDDLDELSKEYGISHGKAAIIGRILSKNPSYSFKELAALSVNELNLILSNPKNNIENVTTTGRASDRAYIGNDKAAEAAFRHAGVKSSDVSELEVDFDYEQGKMVYEVEFNADGFEYEYDIDALSGDVVKSHREAIDDDKDDLDDIDDDKDDLDDIDDDKDDLDDIDDDKDDLDDIDDDKDDLDDIDDDKDDLDDIDDDKDDLDDIDDDKDDLDDIDDDKDDLDDIDDDKDDLDDIDDDKDDLDDIDDDKDDLDDIDDDKDDLDDIDDDKDDLDDIDDDDDDIDDDDDKDND
jgi:hypothetical protein